MYTVQYFCPRQSSFWQGQGQYQSLQVALYWANVVKPPMGNARIIDPYGQVVYQV